MERKRVENQIIKSSIKIQNPDMNVYFLKMVILSAL